FARLTYCYCRVLPWWGGYEWNTVNAALAPGQGFASFSPLWSLGYQTNFSVSLAPGATHGVQLGLVPLDLGAVAGATLTVSSASLLDPDGDGIQLTGDGNAKIAWMLKARKAKCSEAVTTLRLGGVIVGQTNRPPIPGTSLVSLMGPGALIKVQVTGDGSVFSFVLDDANTAIEFGGVLADEVDVVFVEPGPTPENLMTVLDLDLDGLPDLQVSSAAAEVTGLFPQVTGEAVAVAN